MEPLTSSHTFHPSHLPHPHPSLLTNIVKQLPSGDVLHDHEDVSGCGDDLVEFDDVRVTEQLQDLDLPADLLCHIKTVCVCVWVGVWVGVWGGRVFTQTVKQFDKLEWFSMAGSLV